MQKHILSTCLAISLIANTSYAVEPDRTITGTGSSSSTSEMSDGQAAAVVGGLLLLGGILSLHSQSVAKDQALTAETAKVAEEAATAQATKTITLKPGNTYLWSHVDYSPVIEYVESCSPPKQYHNSGTLVNGTVKIGTGSIDLYTESCTRTYDARQKTVQQYSGNPWDLEAGYKKWRAAYETSKARRQAQLEQGIRKFFGSGSNNSDYDACKPRLL